MRDDDWTHGPPVVGMFLNGEEIRTPDVRGRPIVDSSFLLLFNGAHERCDFRLPSREFGTRWRVVVDTAEPGLRGRAVRAGEPVAMEARSVLVLERSEA
jgi:isoamylase